MTDYRFFCKLQRKQKRKRRRFAQNALIAIQAFKAYFHVYDREDNQLLKQKLIK